MLSETARGAKDDKSDTGIIQIIGEWLLPFQEVTGTQPGPVSMILSCAPWISDEWISMFIKIELDVLAQKMSPADLIAVSGLMR